MTRTKTVLIVLVALLIVVSTLCAVQQREIISSQREIASLGREVDSLSEEVDFLWHENINQTQEIISSQQEITSLRQEITSLEDKLRGTLPYSKADGTLIVLRNNFGNVSNPSWLELKVFLEVDDTEKHRYDPFSFVCGDFAEMLHNRAEEEGIRAGVAIVHFTTGVPHALNVFYTADKGLVYIDDTGAGYEFIVVSYFQGTPIYGFAEGEDTVAYVVEGREYGLIPVEQVLYPTGYHVYVDYTERWEYYDSRTEAYNADVDAYNSALGGRHFLEEPEYTEFAIWYDRLEREWLVLEELSLQLGDYWYEPPGVVASIEVYW